MQYYDPKTDVVFKKVFGEHKNLAISLLNAVLKLEGKQRIKDVEYMPSEIIPLNDGQRHSTVDVRCKAGDDDYFIVEMQMYWSSDFMNRVLYNCAKLYATLYKSGVRHYRQKRVYSVNILNDIYEKKEKNNYHYYTISEKDVENPHTIRGIEIVCIELPKFKPQDKAQGKMLKLWQEFLTSINAKTNEISISDELFENDETKEALELCRHLTEDERRLYESFWELDSINLDREKTVKEMGRAEGRAEGEKIGIEKGEKIGIEKGRAEGEKQAKLAIARTLLSMGTMTISEIAAATDLPESEITNLN